MGRRFVALFAAVLVAAALPAAASGDTRPWPRTGVVPGTLLVTTEGPATRARLTAVAGVRSGRALARSVSLVEVAPGAEAAVARRLAALPGVRAVEPNRLRAFDAVPDDPEYPQQWAHQLTGIQGAWDTGTGSNDVLVAIVDSGVVASHPDLAGRVVEQVDAGSGTVQTGSLDNDRCKLGHGTWVAGVLGAVGNNGLDVAGVNWDTAILDINIADPESCKPADAAIIAAVAYATQAQADVINLSLGGASSACPTALQNVLDEARASGALVVAAAGNMGGQAANPVQAPGACNGVVSVGAVVPTGERASYSTFNPYVDLAAPGGSCNSCDPALNVLTTSFYDRGEVTGETLAVAGTSFSSPYVAGLAALLLSVDASLTPDSLEAALEGTARDQGAPGRDDVYGWGLVQAAAAVDAVTTGLIPPLQPDPQFPVGGPVDIVRVTGGTPTEAVAQAVAMSQETFADHQARHVVLARRDDFADALAGSSVTFGVGPLLFTGSQGPLEALTRSELLRVLPPPTEDGETAMVYLMGGTAALPATLEAELVALGYEPIRLAGDTREHTAANAAPVAAAIADGTPYDTDTVLIATRSDWPDAVAAGQLGAFWGMPILLTQPDHLPEPTRDALLALAPARVLVVGGTNVISDAVAAEIGNVAGVSVERLAGPTRTGTAVAVAYEMEELFFNLRGEFPSVTVAVNLRRADGFAHVLSAAPFVGKEGGTFTAIEGDAGDLITEDVMDYACGFGADAVLAGGDDLIADATGAHLGQLLGGTDPACNAGRTGV